MRLNYARTGASGLIYDGVNLTDTFQLVEVSIPLLPTFEAVTQEIAQRPGSYFSSRKVGTRQIKVKLRLDAETRNPMHIFQAWREVSAPFNKPTPRKLYLDEERYCWAIMVGESDINNEAYYGVVEVTFACYDPYFYGKDHHIELSDGVRRHFLVSGSETAYPTLDLTARQSTVTVRNNKTGNFVRIPNLRSGVDIHVDMEHQTCTAGGAYAPVELLSDFFSIDGDADIEVDGASGSLDYKERYL